MNTELENSTNQTNPNQPKNNRRKPVSPFWQLLRKAKSTFDKQLDKDNGIKFRCVERVIGADASDIDKFWLAYKDQVDALLDSKRFEQQCKDKGLSPEIVAEHIVFLGNGAVKRVRETGIDSLGSEILLYQESFTKGKLESVIPAATEDKDSSAA